LPLLVTWQSVFVLVIGIVIIPVTFFLFCLLGLLLRFLTQPTP
jgi:hypothetical protein